MVRSDFAIANKTKTLGVRLPENHWIFQVSNKKEIILKSLEVYKLIQMDLQEIKNGLQELKEIKNELKEIKNELKEIKEKVQTLKYQENESKESEQDKRLDKLDLDIFF